MTLLKVTLIIGFAALLWAQAESALQKAIRKETLEGDLKGAIDQYKKLAQGKERGVAAKALVRLGQCYEKLGDVEARQAYERVVREFGDQKDSAEAARMRLASLGGGAAGKSVTARLVTADIGDRYFWGVARDGRYLIENGANDPAGRHRLSIRDVATGADRVVARADSPSGHLCCTIISPDGKQLAYGNLTNEKLRGELYIANIDGSGRRLLVSGEMGVSFVPGDWSPDGKHISAWIHKEGQSGPIVMVSVADGSYRTIPGDRGWFGKFSADGSHVLFRRHRAPDYKSTDIFIQPVGGGPESLLLTDAGKVGSIAVTPDGHRVLFTSDRNGRNDLWAIRVADDKAAGQPELVHTGVDLIVGVTRDGSCYYRQSSVARDLYVAGLDPATGKIAGRSKRLTRRSSNAGAAWSPDGEWLAYYAQRTGEDATLVIRSVKTGEERERMVKTEPALSAPRWFPDSRSLLMHIDNGRLVQFDAQTFQIRPFLEGKLIPFYYGFDAVPENNRYLVVAPDGKASYFLTPLPEREHPQVMRLDMLNGTRKRLSRMDALALADLAVSSDGRQLAFSKVTLEAGNGEGKKVVWSLMTLPTDGGEPKEVYRTSAGRIGSATWSRDGRRLFFTGGSPAGIYAIPVEGGRPELLDLGMTNPAHDYHFLNISPDGTQIVFADEQKSNEIWVLSNLFGGAAAR